MGKMGDDEACVAIDFRVSGVKNLRVVDLRRDSSTSKVSTPKPKGIPLLIEQQPHAINGLFS